MKKRFSGLLITLVLLINLSLTVLSSGKVMIGGEPFGIKIYTGGAMVVKLDDVVCDTGSHTADGISGCPAEIGGVKVGDIIKSINGKNLTDSDSICDEIQSSLGDIRLGIQRGDASLDITVTPAVDNTGRRKTGMWLRDSTAGIGTVTFIVPSSGEFVGLGHGIYEADTGKLVPMTKGTVSRVSISGADKGTAGSPGELKGFFTLTNTGVILSNTERGVYGILSALPDNDMIEVADRDEIHEGQATVLSTVYGTEPESYSVTLTLSDKKGKDTFGITVTDRRLIEKTGGIVQGMSGSPVIQDGKLIGAVTHVLVDDPLCGYGISVAAMAEEFGIVPTE